MSRGKAARRELEEQKGAALAIQSAFRSKNASQALYKKTYSQAFNEIDHNGDGVIDKQEAKHDEAFKEIDHNGDGVIDKQEAKDAGRRKELQRTLDGDGATCVADPVGTGETGDIVNSEAGS